MPTRVENKVDGNEGTKRQVINDGQRKTTGVACKKKGCWHGYGCFRVPTRIAVSGCPAMRVWRNLKERTKAALICLVSMSWKQPTVPSSSSSSTTIPKPSKQPSASSDSHRNQAVEDCISYINSSSASCSSSSSSSNVTSRSPPPKTPVPETPPSTIAAVPILPPPPLPSHFSPISPTAPNKSTSGIR